MLAEARRHLILEAVGRDGEVQTEALAEALAVSVETIRRDLHVLEDRSQIQRVHGGAVATERLGEASYSERQEQAAAEKRAIAGAVVARVPSDAVVFLDLGTTVEAVARYLPPTFGGTIITNSLRAVPHLARLDRATVLVTGGRMRPGELSLSGSATAAFLDGLHPDIAVISCGAVAADSGITDYDYEEMQVKRLVLATARESFVVADITKFGRVAPYGICGVDRPSQIFTGAALAPAHRRQLDTAGARVVLA